MTVSQINSKINSLRQEIRALTDKRDALISMQEKLNKGISELNLAKKNTEEVERKFTEYYESNSDMAKDKKRELLTIKDGIDLIISSINLNLYEIPKEIYVLTDQIQNNESRIRSLQRQRNNISEG